MVLMILSAARAMWDRSSAGSRMVDAQVGGFEQAPPERPGCLGEVEPQVGQGVDQVEAGAPGLAGAGVACPAASKSATVASAVRRSASRSL